jgi:hypothetical protein
LKFHYDVSGARWHRWLEFVASVSFPQTCTQDF